MHITRDELEQRAIAAHTAGVEWSTFFARHAGVIAAHGPSGRVGQSQVNGRFTTWLQLSFSWGCLEGKCALKRGDAQIQLTCSIGRTRGYIRERLSLVIAARGSAGKVHLDHQVGDMTLLDGHFQSNRTLFNSESLGIQDTAPAHGQQALGRAKGRLDQNLGHITGLVGFLIGD